MKNHCKKCCCQAGWFPALSGGLSNKILQLLTPGKARTSHGKQKKKKKKVSVLNLYMNDSFDFQFHQPLFRIERHFKYFKA